MLSNASSSPAGESNKAGEASSQSIARLVQRTLRGAGIGVPFVSVSLARIRCLVHEVDQLVRGQSGCGGVHLVTYATNPLNRVKLSIDLRDD